LEEGSRYSELLGGSTVWGLNPGGSETAPGTYPASYTMGNGSLPMG